ncbi:MAG TPA: hypothetical protein VGE11_27360 [Pseudonocardia sp.]
MPEQEFAKFDDTVEPVARRRGPDPLALVLGLLTLGMAVAAFTRHLPVLPHFDPRWVLAGVAALVGVLLLLGSIRRR